MAGSDSSRDQDDSYSEQHDGRGGEEQVPRCIRGLQVSGDSALSQELWLRVVETCAASTATCWPSDTHRRSWVEAAAASWAAAVRVTRS